MGLFSWFKSKKKKQSAPEVRQAGIGKDVTDAHTRQVFYKECADLIDEAVQQMEEAKNEYGLVTSYLSDVEKVEHLSGESKAVVTDAAKQLLKLSEERTRIGQKEPSISGAQKGFLALHEEEMPKTIRWLKEEEARQIEIEGKLNYMAGEKSVFTMEYEECLATNEFLKKVMIGVFVGVMGFILLFFWLGAKSGKDLRVPFLLAVIVGLAASMYILVTTRKNLYRMKVAERNRNKVIEVENKIKLKYVNCTWAIDYAYEKYHTGSSSQLEMMWKEYLRIKAEEEQSRKNERQQEAYRTAIIRELRKYGVFDAEIWVLQPGALLDGREMVEVRHSLNIRRQKLRDHIDYNAKQKERNEAAILQFIADYPEYIEETKELLQRYRLLRRQ